MNVGSVGPQALAPLAAALIIGELGGYPVLFAASGITTVLGAVCVYRIRSVPLARCIPRVVPISGARVVRYFAPLAQDIAPLANSVGQSFVRRTSKSPSW